MGNRRISPGLKECAFNLWDKGWELKDIVDTLLVSQASFLAYYIRGPQFHEQGSLYAPWTS